MTETSLAVTLSENADAAAVAAIEVPGSREVDELEVARELVRQARVGGHGKIPTDGQLMSPLAVMNSPH